ncbi:hypothetical protein IMG5_097680 [Ichthyophthirius multifiliis]|uniref:Electron transfer flavoprotein subunit alpha n=1 Tax=Ichthyophthirius multifiliis TaxID=5932 RepID=G0QRU8_ICHMU|nr:hypothetical protein IMG5_097680 [Ichthyophthirius multifiliis]EGR32056.1 hypothetical protein IMG5_097680 [Ichthyophthirius multifiliis]|eukprot:XP_004035542.1 hypothetical protein IMG5_097680 [Ichthyophthirius multifiliis]
MYKKLFKQTSNSFSTLFIAEHNGQRLTKSSYKILSAAKKLQEETHILITGHNLNQVIKNIQETISSDYLNRIIVADHESLKHNLADKIQQISEKIIEKYKYNYIITDSSAFGKDILPRIASKFNSQPATDIINIISKDTFQRPIYAGNAIQTIKLTNQFKFLSFRYTCFDDAIFSVEKKNSFEIEKADLSIGNTFVKHVKDSVIQSDKPELSSAKFVVSGGRGLKSKENFQILEDLANALGETAIGASRAAVDAGYAQNDQQVGQTGKVVAPQLYLAVGISGAIQHVAGMKDSKVIVSINKDPEAPIFKISNYGLVGDLFKIVPELTEKIKQAKQ